MSFTVHLAKLHVPSAFTTILISEKRGLLPKHNVHEFSAASYKSTAAQQAFFKHLNRPATKKAPKFRGKSSSIPLMARWDICEATTLFISFILGSESGATHVSNQIAGMVNFLLICKKQ